MAVRIAKLQEAVPIPIVRKFGKSIVNGRMKPLLAVRALARASPKPKVKAKERKEVKRTKWLQQLLMVKRYGLQQQSTQPDSQEMRLAWIHGPMCT